MGVQEGVEVAEERVELSLLTLQEKAVTQRRAHTTSGTQTPQRKVLEQGERIIRPAPSLSLSSSTKTVLPHIKYLSSPLGVKALGDVYVWPCGNL